MNQHWKDEELEYLGSCPLCGSADSELRYPDMDDWYGGAPGTWNYHECNRCKALYIDPRPRPEFIGRLYERYFTHSSTPERRRGWIGRVAQGMRNDYVNHRYGYRNIPATPGGRFALYLLPPWFRWEWDHWARNLPVPTAGNDHLLDVGCGNGEFLAKAKEAGWKCKGIDFDPAAVMAAKRAGVHATVGSLEDQHFPDESFDVITLSHVIEHVHKPQALISECTRILKPHGILWIATPNVSSLIHRVFKSSWLALNAQHLILFVQDNLRTLLETEGLSVTFLRRGMHVQPHWRASAARRSGLRGFEQVCLPAFLGSKAKLRYQLIELLAALYKPWQGDLVVCATKLT